MKAFFVTVFYQPLYNGLLLLTSILPWADAGVIIIIFTILVRLALFPLSQKSIVAQMKMRTIAPELEKIKEKYKGDQQEQARQTMAFYKEKGINPFSGFLALLIQLPIIFSLYYVFSGGISAVNHDLVYSFIHAPEHVSMFFFGFIDLTKKSIVLAVLAGITQFIQAHIMAVNIAPQSKEPSFANDLAKSMTFQTKYILPIFITFVSYAASSAIALYWVTSNIFSIGQELYVRHKFRDSK